MAAAVGEPDAYAGELPVAFASLKPNEQVTPEELLAFITPLIAERPAVPKRIHILAAVPMTAVGKVYKPRLRAEATRHAMLAQLAQRGSAIAPRWSSRRRRPACACTTRPPTPRRRLRSAS
jgi:fatty-acyl-CoA synthase